MNKRLGVKVLLLLIILECSIVTWGKVIDRDPNLYSEYTLRFEAPKAMLSRDGGEAIEVKVGTVISRPGTYYLSYYFKDKLVVKSFMIKSQVEDQYTVYFESDLMEIFKRVIENYQSEITLYFNYRIDASEAPVVIANYIRSLLKTYPMLVCNVDQCYVYTQNQDTSTIKMKMSYPLQMTENLKKYDDQARLGMNEMLDNHIKNEMKDYEIEEAVIKALLGKVTYSLHNGKVINATSMSHTLQGTFLDGNIVCDGYAKSLMCLLNMVGIPTRYIEGTVTSREGTLSHAWNLVSLQGAYYHVDPTWADQYYESTGFYNYINETDSIMGKTHTWDRGNYPKAQTTAYSCVNRSFNRMYRVEDKVDFMMTLDKIKKEGKAKGCLLLSDQSINNWPQNLVMTLFYMKLGCQYRCTIENKYDGMMIYFSYY